MVKNYQIFQEQLKKIIQNSNLDIGAIYFILKNTYVEIENLYYMQINKEILEESQQEQIKEEEEEEK